MIQGQANYYIGLVVAVSKDDDDRLKNEKEWHEILVDIPGVIQRVPAFPFRDELDEPKLNDKVLVLDVDPLYHSYFLYRKVKEDGFIGFRSSGKMVSITPDDITLGTFDYDSDYAEKDAPESLHASMKLDGDGNINLKAEKTIKLDGYADTSIIANGGNNGGMVNVSALKQLITAINADLVAAGSGANVGAILSQVMSSIEDKKFKH